MGIPVGWNIVRDEAKEKDVLRADVTGSRSPIRRRARGGRTPRSHASAFDTDVLVDASTSRFAHVEHAPRLSHARTQLPPAPPVPELRERDADGEELRRRSLSFAHGHGDGAADSERALPALTPGFAPAGPRPQDDDMFALLRQRQRDRRAAEESNTPRARDDWTRLTAGGRSRRVPPSGRRIELGDLVQGTPPPPHDHERASLSWTSGRRHAPYARAARRSESQPEDNNPFTAHAAAAVSHPPLRRVGHRRIADGPLPASSLRESWSPVSTLDGLGDRERSNSVSSTSSNLHWQTFLSTVVPDPVAPTAESSFASAAASASFTASSRASSSNSNSTASEHTHLTVPSRRGSPPHANESFARACESSDEGDGASTASDTEDEAAANPLSRRRMRPSYFADAPPHPHRHGRNVTDAGSYARRYVRSYYADATSHGGLYTLDSPHGAADGPLDTQGDTEESFATVVDDDDDNTTPAGPASPADRDQELRDARSLLQRLTERGDVGEDFWASVGLTRSFADGVERVQERGRF